MRIPARYAIAYDEGQITLSTLFHLLLCLVPEYEVEEAVGYAPHDVQEEFRAWLHTLTRDSWSLSSNGREEYGPGVLDAVLSWQATARASQTACSVAPSEPGPPG